MNLGGPPRCIMIKLFPGMAKKMASKLMTKFQLDGSSFLNTESKRETLDRVWMSAMCGCRLLSLSDRCERYWLLRVGQNVDRGTVISLNEVRSGNMGPARSTDCAMLPNPGLHDL